MKMIKITNNTTGEILYKQVDSLGWMDTGKEIGAVQWGVCWDSVTVERI